MEQGAMIMPAVAKLPLAMAAPMSRLECVWLASARKSAGRWRLSSRIVRIPAAEITRWVASCTSRAWRRIS